MADLFIPSATIPEGINLLGEVLALVRKAGIKLNLGKFSFLKDRII